MNIIEYKPDSEHNLESVGFDPSIPTTEKEIREYFTVENFDRIVWTDKIYKSTIWTND